MDCCKETIHPRALKGLELFNQNKYFEAHEELEIAWRDESGPLRDLYRGILQAGVAYHHLLNGNITGCIKMLERSKYWLSAFPDNCLGINIKDLKENIDTVKQLVLQYDEDIRVNHIFLKPIQYKSQ